MPFSESSSICGGCVAWPQHSHGIQPLVGQNYKRKYSFFLSKWFNSVPEPSVHITETLTTAGADMNFGGACSQRIVVDGRGSWISLRFLGLIRSRPLDFIWDLKVARRSLCEVFEKPCRNHELYDLCLCIESASWEADKVFLTPQKFSTCPWTPALLLASALIRPLPEKPKETSLFSGAWWKKTRVVWVTKYRAATLIYMNLLPWGRIEISKAWNIAAKESHKSNKAQN